jgi:hypothetical protein
MNSSLHERMTGIFVTAFIAGPKAYNSMPLWTTQERATLDRYHHFYGHSLLGHVCFIGLFLVLATSLSIDCFTLYFCQLGFYFGPTLRATGPSGACVYY